MHNWKDLLADVGQAQVVWVDITGSAGPDNFHSNAVQTQSEILQLDPEELTHYGLSATPTTVLLDSHGVVKWEWPGVMDDQKISQLKTLLMSNQSNTKGQ